MARFANAYGLPAEVDAARVRAWLVRDGQTIGEDEPALEVETPLGALRLGLSPPGVVLRRLVAAGSWIGPESAVAVVDDEAKVPDPAEANARGDASEVGAGTPSTALTVVPPQRLERAEDPSRCVDRPLSPEDRWVSARAASARTDIPRASAEVDVDATALLAYCEQLNRVLGDRGRVRPNDLVLKAAAVALRRVPALNASFMGDALRFYTHVRIGLALFPNGELVAPGVADADLKTLGALAEEARTLEQNARVGRLSADELVPAALALADVGALGVDRADLAPEGAHTALLAMGRIRSEPVVRGGALAPGHRLSLGIRSDERVASGYSAARLLGEIATRLERPESLAL